MNNDHIPVSAYQYLSQKIWDHEAGLFDAVHEGEDFTVKVKVEKIERAYRDGDGYFTPLMNTAYSYRILGSTVTDCDNIPFGNDFDANTLLKWVS